MPAMRKAKVYKGSKTHYAIAIPKDYVRFHELDREENREIILLYDSVLLVVPKNMAKEILEEKKELIEKLLR